MDKTYTIMTESETINAFCDGLKKAFSAAKELAEITENSDWIKTAELLRDLKDSGYKLSRMKDMSNTEREHALYLKTIADKR